MIFCSWKDIAVLLLGKILFSQRQSEEPINPIDHSQPTIMVQQ